MPDQVGRRPSSPTFLALLGVVWVLCGVMALVKLTVGWRLVPGVFFIGVGLFYIRGAAATVFRRNPDR